MKRHFASLIAALLCSITVSITASAQIVINPESGATTSAASESAQPAVAQRVLYGYCSYQLLLEAHPNYALVIAQLQALRRQYEREAEHNEAEFRRQYSEYLHGQHEFPQPILLKRQRDLQDSMERGLAFRTQADSLLQEAEREFLAPLRARVDAAIRAVATERGYDFVVNTDLGTHLYLHPQKSEDITPYVVAKLDEEN